MDPKPARRAPPKPLQQALVDNAPWAPVQMNEQAAAALKAMKRGEALAQQQQYLLEWLIQDVCRLHDMSYRPGPAGDRDTVFAEGKRYVGNTVLKHVNVNMKIFDKTKAREGL